ncbi:MAG: hypothetical protein ACPGWR_06840 [Ardenticatenaceae bacterium]
MSWWVGGLVGWCVPHASVAMWVGGLVRSRAGGLVRWDAGCGAGMRVAGLVCYL